jgi:hypothetical protein
MSSISIKVNLTSLIHGKQQVLNKKGEFTECLVIPIAENNLFKGDKGVYLDLIAWPYKEKQEGKDTHYLRQSFSKEMRENFTKEEKEKLPYFGNLNTWHGNSNANKEEETFSKPAVQPPGDPDDMPF